MNKLTLTFTAIWLTLASACFAGNSEKTYVTPIRGITHQQVAVLNAMYAIRLDPQIIAPLLVGKAAAPALIEKFKNMGGCQSEDIRNIPITAPLSFECHFPWDPRLTKTPTLLASFISFVKSMETLDHPIITAEDADFCGPQTLISQTELRFLQTCNNDDGQTATTYEILIQLYSGT